MKLEIQKIDENAFLPDYAHPTDSGMDLYSAEEKLIKSGETAVIRTGIKIKLPPDTEAQIRPKSGLAVKHSLTVLNTPGTIDEGYRGEICVIMINLGKSDFDVKIGSKIAQMVISPVMRVEIAEVSKIKTDTDRGEDKFGSTGNMKK